MMVIKNVLKVNIDSEVLQNYLNSLNSKKIFQNYYKLFNVTITLPTNTATCEKWMRSTTFKERFSSRKTYEIQ